MLQCTCRTRPSAAEISLIQRAFTSSFREFSSSTCRLEDNPQKDPPRQPSRPSRSEAIGNLVRTVQKSTQNNPSARPSTPNPNGARILRAPAKLLGRLGAGTNRGPGANRGDSRKVAVGQYAANAIRQNRRGQGPEARRRRATRAPRDEADEEEVSEDAHQVFMDLVDPTPKQEIKPFQPKKIELEDLRMDWPAFPTGKIGMMESVEEQLRWLARRFPHGYDSDHELATRLIKGELVAFESEEEKARVLKAAAELQAQAEEKEIEAKGEQVDAKTIGFEGITSQTKSLTEVYLQGKYPQLKKQAVPLLDQVVRQLRNNDTYQDGKSSRFLSKIESLIPQQQPQKEVKGKQAKA